MLHNPPATPKPQKKMRLSGASNNGADIVSSDVLNAVQPILMDESHQNESDLATTTSDMQTEQPTGNEIEQSSGSYVIDNH